MNTMDTNTIIGLLVVIAIIVIVVKIIQKKPPKAEKHKEFTPPKINIEDLEIENSLNEIETVIEKIDYIKTAYSPKWMFTLNEKRAYYKLNEIANKHNLIVFAKVRLFDLVTPQRYHPKYKTNLYKIQAKHVDFVLTKSNLVARYIIELDDSSHEQPDRKERDIFVDNVLTACGYKVLHTKEIKEEEIEQFIKG